MTIDTFILTALRSPSGTSISGGEIAQKLGVTRAAVWARVRELRALGYEIEASPHEGYRLLNSPDVLLGDDLMSRLKGDPLIGRDIRVFQETTSTSDVIERLAADGVREGVVVFAESQSMGRGRLGREWISPAGKGIWFSVLLRPNLRPIEATQLTVAAATAVARAIESETRLMPQVKWPNDILLGSRKVAGILTELSAEVDRVKHLILGVGLDANFEEADFPERVRATATSLRMELGHPVDRAGLAVAMLTELERDYARIRSGRFDSIATEWEALCTTLGRQVSVRVGDRVLHGRAESLASDGALLLRTQHGHLERITGGDVSLKK